MTGLEAFILGIVQGLTEFLPVSSSGHLVIFQELLGLEGDGGLVFEVAVHVATLVAIVVVYRSRMGELIGGVFAGDKDAWSYALKLGVATLPAIAVALLARNGVEDVTANPMIAGVCLLITAAILWTTRATLPKATAEVPSWGAAAIIGCAQAFAILPGISRSGTTVAVALALGIAPAAAAEFSFMMGSIAISGAAVLILPDMAGGVNGGFGPILIGGIASLLAGVAAIKLFLRLLEKRNFYAFSYYLIPTGVLFLAYVQFA
ncbi:MAG: undecaprenyl-diphosphate phosphatase [Myxococcota bacterium]|nr:undecaprenyl-diphosphate phosphatase [Myxococcota bacterium]